MDERLDSWKEIAAHFGRRVRTVQRWEREEGMPVHRHAHRRRGTVFARAVELDAWWRSRSVPPAERQPKNQVPGVTVPGVMASEPLPATGIEAARARAQPAPPRFRVAPRSRAAGRAWLAGLAVLGLVSGSLVAARVGQPSTPEQTGLAPSAARRSDAGRIAPDRADPDRVLQARYLLHRGTLPEIDRAVALCAGPATDPESTAERAAVHECRAHGTIALLRHGLPLAAGLRQARAEAELALALDPGRAEALTLATWARYAQDWDRAAAEAGYRRAAALDPSTALPHHRLAHLLSTAGRHDEAIAELRRAQRASPLSAALNDDGCWFFYRARRHDEAIAEARRALVLEPDRQGALECIVDAAAALGDHPTARRAAVSMLAALHDPAAARVAAAPASEARHRLHARLLERLQLEAPAAASPHAFLTAELGRREEALAWLERSVAEREGLVLLVRVHPAFDSVRADPRLEAILRRAGV
jgi:tetratricopeptide (TPR) repeat protein